ncbi:hypothetical protein N3K66_001774 [Trichothecium roseum]|uniref:Uncharacterized protein n=1 Tax=Trichothecium roseum TaxID=47278 RepID=A0ACC0V956_9HYPO|nr:hypothetical protein N3K66_001774 [Trichothecium roseum]
MLHVSLGTAMGALSSAAAAAMKCQDFTIAMDLTARSAILDLPVLTTEAEVTEFHLNLAQQGNNLTGRLLKGYKDVSGSYNIRATYCEPEDGPGETLQIMTHGIGFDRSYWDIDYDNGNYSYVASAVQNHGYSTLAYDRLGVGESDKLLDVQIYLEVAALERLTDLAREGKLSPKIDAKYEKIVHLGHSFGSAITYNLVNQRPEISQGIVLQGYSHVPDFMGLFALGVNHVPVKKIPQLAMKYPKGYVTPGTRNGVQIAHFGPGDYDESMLDRAFMRAQPNTPGEILTVGSGGDIPSAFTGPSMVITGERDVPFCGGDCHATGAIDDKFSNLIEASGPMFPHASPFNATVVPGAGHGLNMGYSHEFTFDAILDFLDRHV